jgi:hypothetical protein
MSAHRGRDAAVVVDETDDTGRNMNGARSLLIGVTGMVAPACGSAQPAVRHKTCGRRPEDPRSGWVQ